MADSAVPILHTSAFILLPSALSLPSFRLRKILIAFKVAGTFFAEPFATRRSCMKYLGTAHRKLLFGLLLMNAALIFASCGNTAAEKTADPAKVEESRQKHEDMSMKERGS
jgi:hypothetical protein